MNCAWKELLAVLPLRMRGEVDRLGRESLQEIRFRLNGPVELVCATGSKWLTACATEEDLKFTVNMASRYSPWSAQSAANGYITAPGGHRIGLAGDCVVQNGSVTGVRTVSSLCVRVARDFDGISGSAGDIPGNILILGPPGSGKTTLLRDMLRHIADKTCVCVVDERAELFPHGFIRGKRMDVLTGCNKAHGIDMGLRAMGPSCIAVDEITAQSDCDSLMQAGWCGVRLLATAHAANVRDLQQRPVYKPLWECALFETAVILRRDKSWYTERMIR